MKTVKLLLLLLSTIVFSCHNWKISPLNKTPKPIWKLSKSDGVDNFFGEVYPYIYENAILTDLPSKDIDLCLLDIETKKTRWTWNDLFDDDDVVKTFTFKEFNSLLFDKNLIIRHEQNTYCINMETGKTVWRKANDFHILGGICHDQANYYFVSYTPAENNPHKIIKGDLFTGIETELTVSNEISTDFIAVLTAENESYLLVNYTYTNDTEFKGYIGLLNLQNLKWNYKDIEIRGVKNAIQKDDNIIFETNDSINKVKWKTGETQWKITGKPTPNSIVGFFSNKYLMVFDGTSKTMKIDIDSGNTIWSFENEYTNYANFYLNNSIMYYFGDGNLRARNFETTEQLWDITSDTRANVLFLGAFRDFITGAKVENKDYILAQSDNDMYCYEAIK